MDRHKIWRIVANNYRALKEAASEGYDPVVEVFLAGRSGPIRLDQVQTTRDPEFEWALFIAPTEGEGGVLSRDEHFVFAPERYVERVEIFFERSGGREIGFSHGELEDPSSNAP